MKDNQQNAESKLEQAIDIIKTLRQETTHVYGHCDPGAVQDCWNELQDIVSNWQSLTTPAGKELDCEVFILIDGMIARIPKEHEDIFDVTFGSSYMLQVAKENGSYKVVNAVDGRGTNCFIHFKDKEVKVLFTNATPSKPHTVEEGQTQEPVKCNGNCGMNYCDEYGCIENKPEGDVSHLLTPPQEPVGGMKWEDVQILAKKHAEHIIEMGWRDNPDKDDIIADFISGYASAPPPAPIKTEGEDERIRNINPCPFCGGLENEDVYFGQLGDVPKYKITCIPCGVTLIDDRPDKVISNWNNRASAPPSPVGIGVEALRQRFEKETGLPYIHGDGTQYTLWLEKIAASLPQSTGYTKSQILQAAKDAEVSMIDAEHIVSILEKEIQSSTGGLPKLDQPILDDDDVKGIVESSTEEEKDFDLLAQYDMKEKAEKIVNHVFDKVPEDNKRKFLINFINGIVGSAILHHNNRYVKKLLVPDFKTTFK